MQARFVKFAQGLNKVALRWKVPHYDQITRDAKIPFHSTVVVYGANNDLYKYILERALPGFDRFKVDAVAEDETLVRNAAAHITRVDDEVHDGHVLVDFPANVKQATELDQLLDGVNLAVYLHFEDPSALAGKYTTCNTCKAVFNSAFEATSAPESQADCGAKCDIQPAKDITEQISAFDKSVAPLLDYYDQRGLLLKFSVRSGENLEDTIERLQAGIRGAIKF